MSLTPTDLSRATMSRNFGEKELLAGTALRNTGLPAKWTETMDLEVSRHRKKRKQTGGKKINIKLQKKSQNIHESESSDTLQIEVKEADRAKVSQLAYMEHTHDIARCLPQLPLADSSRFLPWCIYASLPRSRLFYRFSLAFFLPTKIYLPYSKGNNHRHVIKVMSWGKGRRHVLEPALPNRNTMQATYVIFNLLVITLKNIKITRWN